MAGRFAVAGTFRLLDRRLVAYGDVVSGTVRVDEGLFIPLNTSMTVSARIQSVEALDRPDRSYVALLLAEDDQAAGLLEAFRFEGEELEVSRISDRTTFAEAVERLRALLRDVRRPEKLVWVSRSQLIEFPSHVFIFRPEMSGGAEKDAKRVFDMSLDECSAVRVGAIGSTDTTTFAAVWPIEEPADGEVWFIHNSVKVNVPAEDPGVTVVHSRLRWQWIEWRYARWRRRLDVLRGTA